MTKTIRLWHGPQVVALISVSPNGMTSQGPTGGAANSTVVDIELDPWAGLIVDHSGPHRSPVDIREGGA